MPRPKTQKPAPQHVIPVPKPTYVTDPAYRKNGIDYVGIVGKLAPLKVVVKKTQTRRRPRRREPALPYHSAATMAYVKAVRKTFWNRPEIFDEFVTIMGEMNKSPGTRLVELINRVVVLFDGYPDLIFSFDSFLPNGYELELQDDAVVIKVYEDGELLTEDGTPVIYGPGTETSRMARSRKVDIDETVEYVRGVKKTFAFRPEVYRQFMLLLQAYHTDTAGEEETIRDVVKLFHGYPALVLGFNEFLPSGCRIHMYDTKQYTIEFRNAKGTIDTTTIAM